MKTQRVRSNWFLILSLVFFAASVVLVINRNATSEHHPVSSGAEALQLDIPDSPWEPAFFEALEERTRAVALPSLRTVVLADHDLEIRFWYERTDVISGVVVRRIGQDWSASWMYQAKEHLPSSAQLVTLGPPTSNWAVFWNKLVNAGILSLPDRPRERCHVEALDGTSYIVETNVSRRYRTYMYSNPQLMNCSEAKQILQIEELIRKEFSLENLKN